MSALTQALLMVGGVPTDPYFSSVVLLLHFDGVNGGSTFTDSSTNNFSPLGLLGTIPPTTSTTQVKFGTASGNFATAGSAAIQYSVLPALDICTAGAPFTIEAWIYMTANSGVRTILGSWRQSVTEDIYILYVNNGMPQFAWGDFSGASPLLSGGSVSLNTWTFITVVRNGNIFTLYIDGVSVASATFSTSSSKSWWQTMIGGYGNSGNVGNFNGYIDDLRITNGVARYTSNFTPPTAPFPNS